MLGNNGPFGYRSPTGSDHDSVYRTDEHAQVFKMMKRCPNGQMMELQVDISDAKLRCRHGDRAWFVTDPRIVHVVRECHNGKPQIQRYLYRNLNKRGLSTPFYKQYQINPLMEYRCFYSNADIYIISGRLLGWRAEAVSMWTIPWALTKEHVVPRRDRDPNLINTIGNIVPCAMFLNRVMAHMPLAIKLLERDFLHTVEFDRTAMTYETAWDLRNTIIQFEQPFWFVDNYPWFPHAIKDPQAKIAANEFFRRLSDHEAKFLQLSWRDQRQYLLRPCDLDVCHLAKTVLGLPIRGQSPLV